MPNVFENKALNKMRAGEAALGIILRATRAGDFAHVARVCDHDFLFIDMQHGAYSLETTADLCLAALAADVAPLVRLAGPGNLDASRLLDSGAMGIIIPGVANAAEARRAVNVCKFPPYGRRSVSAGYPQLGYAPLPLKDAIAFLNQNTLVACMIETIDGMNNLEEIAAVEGVDVLHLGVNDLLTELGVPNQYDHPTYRSTLDRLLVACKKNGKYAGLGGDKTPAHQAEFLRRGGSFVTTHSEIGYLTAAASERAAYLRKAQKEAVKAA